jgi:hypothetical protein
MTSLMDPSIHIIGDAAPGGEFPEPGFASNNEAKMTAMIIRADVTGACTGRFSNLCWNSIAPDACHQEAELATSRVTAGS